MNFFFFIIPFTILAFTIITKFVVTDQFNEIKILDQEIFILEGEIEKIRTDMTYTINPQNLKKINDEEFKLFPILEKDRLKLEN